MTDKPPETHGAWGARAAARSPGGLQVTVASASMAPTLAVGARVRVRGSRAVRVGDVALLVSSGGAMTLHRVLVRLPRAAWLIHGGDAPGAAAQFARVSTVVGVADVARQRPTARQLLEVTRLLVDRGRRGVAARAEAFRGGGRGGPSTG